MSKLTQRATRHSARTQNRTTEHTTVQQFLEQQNGIDLQIANILLQNSFFIDKIQNLIEAINKIDEETKQEIILIQEIIKDGIGRSELIRAIRYAEEPSEKTIEEVIQKIRSIDINKAKELFRIGQKPFSLDNLKKLSKPENDVILTLLLKYTEGSDSSSYPISDSDLSYITENLSEVSSQDSSHAPIPDNLSGMIQKIQITMQLARDSMYLIDSNPSFVVFVESYKALLTDNQKSLFHPTTIEEIDTFLAELKEDKYADSLYQLLMKNPFSDVLKIGFFPASKSRPSLEELINTYRDILTLRKLWSQEENRRKIHTFVEQAQKHCGTTTVFHFDFKDLQKFLGVVKSDRELSLFIDASTGRVNKNRYLNDYNWDVRSDSIDTFEESKERSKEVHQICKLLADIFSKNQSTSFANAAVTFRLFITDSLIGVDLGEVFKRLYSPSTRIIFEQIMDKIQANEQDLNEITQKSESIAKILEKYDINHSEADSGDSSLAFQIYSSDIDLVKQLFSSLQEKSFNFDNRIDILQEFLAFQNQPLLLSIIQNMSREVSIAEITEIALILKDIPARLLKWVPQINDRFFDLNYDSIANNISKLTTEKWKTFLEEINDDSGYTSDLKKSSIFILSTYFGIEGNRRKEMLAEYNSVLFDLPDDDLFSFLKFYKTFFEKIDVINTLQSVSGWNDIKIINIISFYTECKAIQEVDDKNIISFIRSFPESMLIGKLASEFIRKDTENNEFKKVYSYIVENVTEDRKDFFYFVQRNLHSSNLDQIHSFVEQFPKMVPRAGYYDRSLVETYENLDSEEKKHFKEMYLKATEKMQKFIIKSLYSKEVSLELALHFLREHPKVCETDVFVPEIILGKSEIYDKYLRKLSKDTQLRDRVLNILTSKLFLRLDVVMDALNEGGASELDQEEMERLSGLSVLRKYDVDPNTIEDKTVAAISAIAVYRGKYKDNAAFVDLIDELLESLIQQEYQEWKYGDLKQLKEDKILPTGLTRDQYDSWKENREIDLSEALSSDVNFLKKQLKERLIDNMPVIWPDHEDEIAESLEILFESEQLQALGLSKDSNIWGLDQDTFTTLKKEAGRKMGEVSRIKKSLSQKEFHTYVDAMGVISLINDMRELFTNNNLLLTGSDESKSKGLKSIIEKIIDKLPSTPETEGVFTSIEKTIQNSTGSIESKNRELRISFTDDPNSTWRIGEDPVPSCQHYRSSSSHNAGLIGLTDPDHKLILVRDEEGKPIARRIIRLLEDSQTGEPVLQIARLYTANASPLIETITKRFAKIIAQEMGVKVQKDSMKKKAGRAPTFYIDEAGGLNEGGFEI